MRSSTRLFAIYAVAGLLPIGALGAILLLGARDDAARQGRDQGTAQAAVIAEMAVAPALGHADLSAGLTGAQRDELTEATELATFRGSVLQMRVRSFTGQVVFSDDGSTAGGVPIADPAFRSAAAGETVATIEQDGTSRVIRVLQPIVGNASGESIGVLELYLPYDQIAAQLHRQMTAMYWRLGAGLGCLYLLLALISWTSTRSLRRYAEKQAHEALHDGLTGLPNREAFRVRAETELAPGATGAVVIVDLNRFKQINDTLGHHAGDELLRVIAHRLRDGLRATDTLARLGGDEFAMILPGLGEDDAVALLNTWRRELTRDVLLDGVPVNPAASFGVAFYPHHGDTIEELLKCADAAMYRGKRGADDVVVYALTPGGTR